MAQLKKAIAQLKQIFSQKNIQLTRFLPLIALIIALPLSLILVSQRQDMTQHAAVEGKSTFDVVAFQRKVAGIKADGTLEEDRAEDLKFLNPKGYQQLVKQGIVRETEPDTKPSILPLNGKTLLTPIRKSLTPSISSCGDIAANGNYILTRDIGAVGACIMIHDTQNVTLDCQNHTITATNAATLTLRNVQNYSVKNCTFRYSAPTSSDSGESIHVENSSTGSFDQNIIQNGYMNVTTSNYLQVLNNTVTGTYQQGNSWHNLISNNTITVPSNIFSSGNIISTFGGNNTIQNNIIDGSWDGVVRAAFLNKSADDGIALQTESQDIISGNTIKNVWDCGIETLGFIQNTQFLNNQITNANDCGIGAWYWNSWLGNTVQGNVVDQSSYIFLFYSILYDPDQQTIYFKDNLFTNNTFLRQSPASWVSSVQPYFSAYIDFLHPYPVDYQGGNNRFKDNDFNNTIGSPAITTVDTIIDLGGNKCIPVTINDVFAHPLTCVTPTPTPTLTPTITPTKIPTPTNTPTPSPTPTKVPTPTPTRIPTPTPTRIPGPYQTTVSGIVKTIAITPAHADIGSLFTVSVGTDTVTNVAATVTVDGINANCSTGLTGKVTLKGCIVPTNLSKGDHQVKITYVNAIKQRDFLGATTTPVGIGTINLPVK